MRKGSKVSYVRIHPAVVTEDVVLLISPGPALTPGLVMDVTVAYECRLCQLLLPGREPSALHSPGQK